MVLKEALKHSRLLSRTNDRTTRAYLTVSSTMRIMFRPVFPVIRLQFHLTNVEHLSIHGARLIHHMASPPSTHPVPRYVAPAASAVLRIHVSTSFVPRDVTVLSHCTVIFCGISRCSSPSRHRVHDGIEVICGTSPYGLHTQPHRMIYLLGC